MVVGRHEQTHPPPAGRTRNWPAYNEAPKRRGSLTIWFDPAMTWEATPTGKRGRQPDYSDAAIQTCLTMKVLFGMALRTGHCWPAAIRSTSLPELRGRNGGQDGHETGNPSARSGSTRNDPKPGAEAMGPPTRSPMKLAAAVPWPGKPNAQRENQRRRQLP